ncbi:phosphomevalonate kinase [Phaffia rhodozyma]|uniref:Phosphomevalonate kinase n=1 Tax=Phaffia rhodozyma TaxID=264483 RepID=A0A0F7SG81_PHARH|nr:phosphomevalonate kinase [Phaffia rhodozyma]
MTAIATTAISSPGKVLLAGGYLVLDPVHTGLVVSTSSRFYTVIRSLPPSSSSTSTNTIVVQSPQFESAQWRYQFDHVSGRITEMENDLHAGTGRNKFVLIALEKTIRVAGELVGWEKVNESLKDGWVIVIVGDNDFYSQRKQLESRGLPLSFDSLAHLPPFSKTNESLANVHKTGLGSSAALITSLCAALLLHLGAVSPLIFKPSSADPMSEERREMRLVHNVAQYAHCLAQGKVGSGFDVSSAVWGSQIYRKFEKDALEELMEDEQSDRTLVPTLSPENPRWTNQVTPFSFPPRFRLLLADVDAGSDTPSLVGKVLKWKKDNPSQDSWSTIDGFNDDLASQIRALGRLAASDPVSYETAVQDFIRKPAEPSSSNSQPFIKIFQSIQAASQSIRRSMKLMGESAGVPIEPDEQTELLDKCQTLPGVLGCGVPGAGGYDALWVLILDTPSTSTAQVVEKTWTEHTGLSVCPLLAHEDPMGGLQIHDVDHVTGLRECL